MRAVSSAHPRLSSALTPCVRCCCAFAAQSPVARTMNSQVLDFEFQSARTIDQHEQGPGGLPPYHRRRAAMGVLCAANQCIAVCGRSKGRFQTFSRTPYLWKSTGTVCQECPILSPLLPRAWTSWLPELSALEAVALLSCRLFRCAGGVSCKRLLAHAGTSHTHWLLPLCHQPMATLASSQWCWPLVTALRLITIRPHGISHLLSKTAATWVHFLLCCVRVIDSRHDCSAVRKCLSCGRLC